MRFAEYGKLLTEAYDLDKPEPPAIELAFYERHCARAQGPVLEAMCGSGRFLVPLAVAGVDIDGIDASPDMLAACQRKCDEHAIAPHLALQSVQDLDLPRRYALAFVAAGSFGLIIDDTECRASLARLHEHLAPGGALLVDIETPATPRRADGRWFGRWWTRPDGAKIVLRTLVVYDPDTRIEEGLGIYELWNDSTLVATECNDWVRRYWEPDDFRAELELAGFVDMRVEPAAGFEQEEAPTTLSVECRSDA
jgi:SAM-dependent methyltransferase